MAADPIQWDDLEIEWDGSRFTLHVPHDLTDWAARWLELNLPMSIRGLMGEIEVAVTAASGAAGTALRGRLSLGPIMLPLRGGQIVAPGKLRAIVDRAAAEAQVAVQHAVEHAAAFAAELRKA